LTESIGEVLRQAREARGISLAEAEEATKVRQKFLEALEQDDFQRLPGEVYRRGFLKSYAIYLGLDPEPLLARYRAQRAPAEEQKAAPGVSAPRPGGTVESGPPAAPAATAPIQPLARPLGPTTPFNTAIFWVPLLVIALLVAGFFAYQRYGQPYGQRLLATFTRATPTPTFVPTPTITPTPPLPTPIPTPQPTATPALSPTPTAPTPPGIVVDVRVLDRVWLRVTVDDAVVFEGVLEPVTVRSWSGRNRVAIKSGIPGSTYVTVNGEYKGAMGPPSQEPLELVWTKP
jgi:transcriptional regulator with XRE-family HTH domain